MIYLAGIVITFILFAPSFKEDWQEWAISIFASLFWPIFWIIIVYFRLTETE